MSIPVQGLQETATGEGGSAVGDAPVTGAVTGVLPDSARREIEALYPRYPQRRSVLLPALWIAQGALGWLPAEAMEEIAEMLDLEPVEVEETASFYTLFF